MGVKEILTEWITFREECVRRRIVYDLQRKREKLHLLEGLERILLDIDEAIRIVRETKEESEVVPNLMQGFSMDEIQAEYVAEIKLRHLNREYILRRTQEMEQLRTDIDSLQQTLESPKSSARWICRQNLTRLWTFQIIRYICSCLRADISRRFLRHRCE